MAEAHRWNAVNMIEAGMVIGWLMGYHADFYHPSGLGPTTRLAIHNEAGDTVIAENGDWIIHDSAGWHVARELQSVEAAMIKDLQT